MLTKDMVEIKDLIIDLMKNVVVLIKNLELFSKGVLLFVLLANLIYSLQ